MSGFYFNKDLLDSNGKIFSVSSLGHSLYRFLIFAAIFFSLTCTASVGHRSIRSWIGIVERSGSRIGGVAGLIALDRTILEPR